MTKILHITAPGPMGFGTVIKTAEGAEVAGVTYCRITIQPDDIVTADLEVQVGAVDVTAHPLLGLDTITEAAKAHGFRLVPLGDAA